MAGMVKLLGPVGFLDRAHEPVELAGSAQRRLLCALAIVAPDTQRSEFLCDRLAMSPTALRSAISRLRARVGAEVIVAEASGYRIGSTTDAREFERLLAERSIAASRLEHLEAAIELWGGPAIDEFSHEVWARATAVRLNELRLSADEDRCELLIGLDRATEAVARLQALITQHPQRDRSAGLLMQALACEGRHAEALRVCQTFRRSLAELSGISPSLGLLDIERRVAQGAGSEREEVIDSLTSKGFWTDPEDQADPGSKLVTSTSAEGPPPPVGRSALTSSQSGNLIAVRARVAGLTSFIGRVDEVEAIREAIDRWRLVTIVGPGGMGKTRLALEAAAGSEALQERESWVVDLASIAAGDAVGEAVAEALGLQQRPGETWDQTVFDALSIRDLLLVLDNCERFQQSTAAFVGSLLRRTDRVTVLATGRTPLSLPGEHVLTLSELAEAIDLFRDRASLVDPSFEVDESTITLCDRLDRMPLAIELAAARVQTLRPADLLERLSDRFRILRSGPPGSSRAETTLIGTLEWSLSQLTDRCHQLFAALSIFVGDFDLESAVSVSRGDFGADLDELAVLDDLGLLVRLSLIVPVNRDGTARFRLLETMKAYGRSELNGSGRLDAISRAHAEHYRTRTAGLLPHLDSTEPTRFLKPVGTDHADIRGALDWALVNDELLAAELATNTAPFWWWNCHFSIGAKYLRAIAEIEHDRSLDALRYEIVCRHARSESAAVLELTGKLLSECPDDEVLSISMQQRDFAGDAAGAEADFERFRNLDHPRPGERMGIVVGASVIVGERFGRAADELLATLDPLYRGTSSLVDVGLDYGQVYLASFRGDPAVIELALLTAAKFEGIGMTYLAGQMHYVAGAHLRILGDSEWLDHSERGVQLLLDSGTKRMPSWLLQVFSKRANNRGDLFTAVVLAAAADRFEAEYGLNFRARHGKRPLPTSSLSETTLSASDRALAHRQAAEFSLDEALRFGFDAERLTLQ